jgi:hypothetical protein
MMFCGAFFMTTKLLMVAVQLVSWLQLDIENPMELLLDKQSKKAFELLNNKGLKIIPFPCQFKTGKGILINKLD